MKTELSGRLQTLLNADVAALQLWISQKESDAKAFVADPPVREAILGLAEQAKQPGISQSALAQSQAARALQLALKPLLESHKYLDYVVIGAGERVLASPMASQVGGRGPAATGCLRGGRWTGNPPCRGPLRASLRLGNRNDPL